MCANVIVRDRESGRIIQLIEVSLDDATVRRVLDELKLVYGPHCEYDLHQVELARAARAA